MLINPEIFRAYDVRGIVGAGLYDGAVRQIGRALATTGLGEGVGRIVIARDGRESSPELLAALGEGIRAAGVDTIDIGMAPSPVAYWSAFKLAGGSCAVVTGSHNPREYNGVKMMLAGRALAGEEIQEIRSLIAEQRFPAHSSAGEASEDPDIIHAYIESLLEGRSLARPVKVVVDCGNGATGACAPGLLERLGADVIPLFAEVDGAFPNHHPDPADPANFAAAARRMAEAGAELAIAFDGDGDRLGAWLPESGLAYPDRLLMLLARDLLADPARRGATVIYDVKCSAALGPFIRDLGGEPLMVRTGHSFVKRAMGETGSPLAGELSGHFFFSEGDWRFDDAMYAAVRLLELVAGAASAEELLASVPDSHATPELRIELDPGADAAALVAGLAKEGNFPGCERLVTIDGVRAEWEDGFGLVRPSNTTPALILRFEGADAGACGRIMTCFRGCLRRALPDARIDF